MTLPIFYLRDLNPSITANASLYQCCSGLCIDLLKHLKNAIGFEIELFQVEDKKFGSYNKVQLGKTVLTVSVLNIGNS